METWPGTREYQPTAEAAACQCNLVVYNQTASCMTCQSSTSAKYSVIDLPGYKRLCTFFGQKDFPDFPIPASSSTTSQPALPTGSDLPSEGGKGGSASSHSSLSSGAVAGIIVSAVALIVALSVAGYVYARRKRELAKQKEEEELYKFQENSRNSYMEAPLPQYTGMIQSSHPSLPQLTNLRVMNPDSDDDDNRAHGGPFHKGNSFEVQRGSSPGWRRGSFDDD
ncbi:hypothetical protein BGX24_000227 [Mortierella sp. AD032]|nr:hypothetical protein BGX24_000227 [Mortierella sp. AD032]